jgi:hypothetical protein
VKLQILRSSLSGRDAEEAGQKTEAPSKKAEPAPEKKP